MDAWGTFWIHIVCGTIWKAIIGIVFFYFISFVVFMICGESLLFKISRWIEQGRRYKEDRKTKRQI